MPDIYQDIGRRIRQIRSSYNGVGISQGHLAEQLGVNVNSISRWESAVTRPTISDLDALSKFFGVPINYFLPESEMPSWTATLLSAINGMSTDDLQEVIRYAHFRRAISPLSK